MTLFKNGIEVSFKPNLTVEKYEKYEEHTLKYEYDSNWISENLDFPTLLNNFIYLFDFTDNNFRSSYVYKSNESGIYLKIFSIKEAKQIILKIICLILKIQHSL